MSGGIPVSSANGSPWSSGICDCFSDMGSCCLTVWLPCVTFGLTSEIVDEGSTSCVGNGLMFTLLSLFTPCPCLYTCLYRARLRAKYGLYKTPCNDYCVHFWCLSCALCQEYRELKNRGFDMFIGWKGNARKQNRGVEMAPVVEEQMRR